MKCQISLLLLLASIVCLAQARRTLSHFNEPAALARSSDAALAFDPIGDQDKLGAGAAASSAAAVSGNTGIKDASSGRLFLKKFLKFKNMFSSNNQPVIPIIITGGGTSTTGTSPTSPTVTVTSTGTIPTATGTITTSPTSPTTPTTTTARGYNVMQDDQEQADDDEPEQEHGLEHEPAAAVAMAANAELIDEQALQSALAAGAQEYEVFTQGEQPDESKATQNNRISLRRKGGRRGQKGEVISVRVPPRYRRYFKNGQKVMLNTKNRPAKRRVVRKRIQGGGNKNNNKKRFNNRRRGNKNKNKKNKNKNKNKRTRIPVV